jgi:Carboxypeptidase regulatory-like domain
MMIGVQRRTSRPRLSPVCLAAIVLSTATLGLGQYPGSSSGSQPPQPGQLEGVVVSAATGLPLPKISLHLRQISTGILGPLSTQSGTRTLAHSVVTAALSDGSGQFVFRSLAPGKYVLWGQGTAFPSQSYGQLHPLGRGKILTLSPGQDLKNVEFRMQPEVVITGRVLDEDGDPISRVPVHALVESDRSGQTRYLMGGSDSTNDLGEYRLFGLHAGHYYVEAAPRPWGPRSADSNGEIYAAEFYPGTFDLSQATPLDTHPGDQVSGIDISLTPVKPAQISGQVVSRLTGQPVMGAYVNVQRAGTPIVGLPGYISGANTNSNGTFEVDRIAPGSYLLSVQCQQDGKSLFGSQRVDPAGGENLSGVEMDIAPGANLTGSVILPPGGQLKPNLLSVILRPINGPNFYAGGARVKANGTFKLESVAPGAYRVNVFGFPEEYYLKSVTLNGADVLASGLTIYPGQPDGTLSVALSLDGGRISGIVINQGKPISDATVVLVPDPPLRNRDDLYSTKHTDEQGRFSMLGLPPGDYKLFAWEDLEGEEFKSPAFMNLFEARGQSVHIDARSTQSVELQVIPADAMPQ